MNSLKQQKLSSGQVWPNMFMYIYIYIYAQYLLLAIYMMYTQINSTDLLV